MQFCIPPQHKAAAGVYLIGSQITDKVYVGSTQNLFLRYNNHKGNLIRGVHPNHQLQEFVNRHGIESLSFELLEVVALGEELGRIEQKWIDANAAASYGFNATAKVSGIRYVLTKAALNMQLDADLLKAAHEMADEDGISLSGLVRMLLIREKKRRDAEKQGN